MQWDLIAEHIFKIIRDNAILLTAIGTAMLMSILTTAKNGKVDWIEGGMCGLFTFSIWFVLGLFNLPAGAAVFIGGVIGCMGTKWLTHRFKEKFGGTKDE